MAVWKASSGVFKTKPLEPGLFPSSKIPRADITGDISATPSLKKSREELTAGIPAFELFYEVGLCASKGEARRVIAQSGGYVNDRQILSFDERIGLNQINDQGEIRLRKGKKKYFIITVT